MNKYNVSEDNLKMYLEILQGDDYKNVITKLSTHNTFEYCVNIKSIFRDYVEKSMHIIVSYK